ncbi:hypothetical protein [Mesorhizobium amorphae]|uniref:hypothetical protein n=1 Tax=Mesorhizobium amorphae TaxID=71433 RepID=UPI00177D6FEE|nr:hypothetical protein [Mesorhizobium amorphae]
MRALASFFRAVDRGSTVVENFLAGPPSRRPTKADRVARLGHMLPTGKHGAAVFVRQLLIQIDDVKHGLPQIKWRSVRLLLYVGFGPVLLTHDILSFCIRLGRRTRRTIVSAPASGVLAVIRFLVPKKAYERIFAQAVEDFREEYYLELSERRVWRARWLHVCLYVTLLATAALWLGTSAAKKVFDLSKIS